MTLICFPQGAPIVVSFPHFYQADPTYINAIDGLNPNKEEHETYLDLQPVCWTLSAVIMTNGCVMDFDLSFQIRVVAL